MKRENIINWLGETSKKKLDDVGPPSKIPRDSTIYDYYLNDTIEATMEYFDNVILTEEPDSVVFFYSTEVVNYQQRVEAFQFNLVAERMPRLRDIKNKVKFYSYDVWENGGVPFGIPHLTTPPPDI